MRLYHRFLDEPPAPCYSSHNKPRATPGKEKAMIATRFSLSYKEHTKEQSSPRELDRFVMRSCKVEKNGCGIW